MHRPMICPVPETMSAAASRPGLRLYYEDEWVTLYCGDARLLAPHLPPVDAIVADPPYEATSLEWDVWPQGWPGLVLPLARQLWCFGSQRMFWDYRDEFKGWKLGQDLVWEKHNGSGIHADRFRRVHETVLHFYNGEWGSLHLKPPVVRVEETRFRSSFKRGKKAQHLDMIESGSGYDYDGTRLMRSVLPVRSCHGYAVNETQKPEALVAPLLEYSVPPGGIVFDPFAGSGTTLAVARSQGKRAIGVEKRESQCREIVNRLKTTLALTGSEG